MNVLPRWVRVENGQPSTLGTLDDLFHSVLKRLNGDLLPEFIGACGAVPKLEVKVNVADVVAEIPLPGYRPAEIDIEVVGDCLTVRATRENEENAGEASHYLRRERSTSAYEETVRFPVRVKGQATKATYVDGVLRVVMPRVDAEQAAPHIVKVD